MLYDVQNPHGGDVYEQSSVLDFSVNLNPYGVPAGVREAVHEAVARIDQYPDPYCRDLVRAIAAAEKVPPSFILCGNGAAELIYAYCGAVAPRMAAEMAPTFSEYELACALSGCRMERFFLSRDHDFRLGAGILPFLKETKPDVLFLCNPNNPDGRVIPPELLDDILQVCRDRSIRLFVDECFLDLSDQGVSMKHYLEAYSELFLLKAFTKNYGIAGLRLGYCLSANRDLLRKMSLSVQPWNVSVIAQAAGVAAMKETDHIRKAREAIRSERPWLKEQLDQMGFHVCRSEANYLLFQGPDGLDEALLQAGIRIRNCSNYAGLGQGWYRIAVRLHEDNMVLIRKLQSLHKGHDYRLSMGAMQNFPC